MKRFVRDFLTRIMHYKDVVATGHALIYFSTNTMFVGSMGADEIIGNLDQFPLTIVLETGSEASITITHVSHDGKIRFKGSVEPAPLISPSSELIEFVVQKV